MSIIWQFKTAQFQVRVEACEDFDIDLSFDDTGEIAKQIESGELQSFAVRARCVHLPSGCMGEDYLGGCIYKSPEDFRDHVGIRERERRDLPPGSHYGSYFSDMVRTAIKECRDACGKVPQLRERAA